MHETKSKRELRRKIGVMQAALGGRVVESKMCSASHWSIIKNPNFNWEAMDYRIAPDQPTEPDPGEGYELCEPEEGEWFWNEDIGKWYRTHVNANIRKQLADNNGYVYRRRTIPKPDPHWHDDAAPTVDQAGDWTPIHYMQQDGTLNTARAAWVREHWELGVQKKRYWTPVAWHDPPTPYVVYQPPTTWQRSAERPPTEADGDSGGYVSAVDSYGALLRVVWHDVATRPDAFPEWIRTASLLNACRE